MGYFRCQACYHNVLLVAHFRGDYHVVHIRALDPKKTVDSPVGCLCIRRGHRIPSTNPSSWEMKDFRVEEIPLSLRKFLGRKIYAQNKADPDCVSLARLLWPQAVEEMNHKQDRELDARFKVTKAYRWFFGMSKEQRTLFAANWESIPLGVLITKLERECNSYIDHKT